MQHPSISPNYDQSHNPNPNPNGGKRIIALSDPYFREIYSLDSKEQIEMLMRPDGVLTKLNRELDLLKHLDHPNIIALPGIIYDDVEGVAIPMYCLQKLGEGALYPYMAMRHWVIPIYGHMSSRGSRSRCIAFKSWGKVMIVGSG